ncbi:MAG: hypothetical protein HUU54_08490 [Ignavibacteriaceae bacterium]|nr:hypothetical protein [Ignavibacteriaceae bacterium]
MSISKLRTILYTIARLLGDVNAAQKGKLPQRLMRRAAGKLAGKILSKLPK